MIKITLIIPVYNVEKYIEECLSSCINQTLKEIEIICVDDCSPDNSIKLIENYAKTDSRIRIIRHKENLGLGGARNTGIEEANGEYIWFIDSDDFISQESCQILYDTAKKNNVEILTFNGINFETDENGNKLYSESPYYNEFPKNININIKRNLSILDNYFPVSAVHYIAKREFISQYKFRTHVYYEDTDFTPILFSECLTLRSICFTAYHRRINPESITQSKMTEKKVFDRILVHDSLINYLNNKKIGKNCFLYKLAKSCIMEANNWSSIIAVNSNIEIEKKLKQTSFGMLDEELINKIKNYSTLIVYGAGKISKLILHDLKICYNGKILVCVTEKMEQDSFFEGYKVFSINEIYENQNGYDCCVLVAVGQKNKMEMFDNAVKVGFSSVFTLN